VYKARISEHDEPVDDLGTKGRWHLYWVQVKEEQIEALSSEIRKSWYAHFWKGQRLMAVFPGRKFDFQAVDKSTWKEVIEYGRSVGIPEEQLDFPTD